jgi:hypothetical protein
MSDRYNQTIEQAVVSVASGAGFEHVSRMLHSTKKSSSGSTDLLVADVAHCARRRSLAWLY